ncbi:MAG TPA: hypothetical protein VFJ75_10380 [Gaiellaceae bacterium]|nr:hypothetical protein [Gaiellaceae bacterium]
MAVKQAEPAASQQRQGSDHDQRDHERGLNGLVESPVEVNYASQP